MNWNQAVFSLRSARWAVAMAGIGLCYALATSGPGATASAEAQAVSARALGTNATRPPATFVTGPNLGATVVGSNFARQILVRFGFAPHVFRFSSPPSNTGTILNVNGKLSGNNQNAIFDIFNIACTDSPGGIVLPPTIQTFGLLTLDQQYGTPLHFEDGSNFTTGTVQNVTLTTALSGQPYFFTLQPNGGVPPYTMTFSPKPSGTRFMPQGLALNLKTGLVYGKPVMPTPTGQPATFDVLLTDNGGGQVTGHFSLDIEPGTITSQAVAVAGNMQILFGNAFGKDSLSLTMLIDKSGLNSNGILQSSDLNGLKMSMDFGGLALPPAARPKSLTKIVTTFDAKGEISVPPAFKVVGDPAGGGFTDVIYKIKLDPKHGILSCKFQNLKMAAAIGANELAFNDQSDPTNRGPILPIDIKIGLAAGVDPTDPTQTNVFEETDIVKFVYKQSGGLGKGTASKNDNLAPGGLFLINKVFGTEQTVVVDSYNNVSADRLFLTMKGLMRAPGAAPVIPKNGDNVEVFIGQLCLGTFPANSFAAQGGQLIFNNADTSKGLQQLVIDNNKGTVLITTHGLDPNSQLFGVDILVAGTPYTVPITVTIVGADPLHPTFDGQSTVTLFRTGSKLFNRQP